MPPQGSFTVPLSSDGNETVRLALEFFNFKIYAVASITLSFSGAPREFAICNLQGALALCRDTTTRQLSLQLIDLYASPGTINWQRDLSSTAQLKEMKEAGAKRTYLLTDSDTRATLVFADDMEASKFTTKFIRTTRRGTGSANDQVQGSVDLDIDLSNLSLDDRTIRGSELTTNEDTLALSIEGDLASSWSHSASHVEKQLEECANRCSQSSETPSQSLESECNEEDQLNKSDDEHITDAQQDSHSADAAPDGPDTWICHLKGFSCRLPDLTSKLESLEEIALSEPKGKGGCGIIRRAWLRDGTNVAIKTLLIGSRDTFSKDMRERKRFRNEVAMQSILSHTNILPLLGIAEAREHKLSASLVLPWMENTDSRTYLKKNPHVLRLPLILGTIRGIAFLHSKGIVHGDIKARNVLISDDGTPLLSDFGLTSFAEEDDREMSHSMVSAGSNAWMAIELHESRTPALAVTKYSDMWAFGMTIIELLTGDSPFPSRVAWRVIMFHDYDNYPKKPVAEECTDTLWELTQRCWKEEPTSRPTADESVHLIESITASPPS